MIHVDTREQKPLDFSRFENISTDKSTVPAGDYSCHLINDRLCGFPIAGKTIFERKSKSDLWGTLGGDHSRFKRELMRAKDHGIKLILIVECSQTAVYKGHKYRKQGRTTECKFSGPAMIKKLETFRQRYGLETVFCKNREEMELYIYSRWMAECRELEIPGENNES